MAKTKETAAKQSPRFKVGSKVAIHVGRGTFPGKVVDFDETGKWAHVEAKTGPEKTATVKTYLRRVTKLGEVLKAS